MTGTHRRSTPTPISRRAVIGGVAAAVVSVSGAAVGLRQLLSGRSTATDAGNPATAPSPGSPSTSARPPSASGAARATAPAKAAPSAGAAPRGGPVRAPTDKVLLGAYLGLSEMSFTEALALRRRQLGRDERIVHVFYAWRDTLPTKVPGLPNGAIPMISWRGTKYAEILNGDADDLIATAARRLARSKRPTLLRWGWEMNGNWFAWGGSNNGDDPSGYVACWKRLRKIFRAEGADNVAWVWSINWNSHPDSAWNRFQAYYPGDKYVDWVGISGYNLKDEPPTTLYDALYREYAARKPMMITEVGAVDRGGNTKAEWITDFAGYVEQRPGINGVVWFDTDTHPNYPEVWRIDSDAAALAAYRAMARNPRFAG